MYTKITNDDGLATNWTSDGLVNVKIYRNACNAK